jgi:thiamine monophosphate synthase
LGWNGFEALAVRAELPVYALGGLSAADLATARARGAQGIAMIRGAWLQPSCAGDEGGSAAPAGSVGASPGTE